MSLQDKIASAKPTTFLTDGLSGEEVKQAVDEGKKRVSDTVKLIIEIPRNEYEYTCERTLSDRTFWDDAIRKGVPLEDVKAEIRAEQEKYSHPLEIERAIEILNYIGEDT